MYKIKPLLSLGFLMIILSAKAQNNSDSAAMAQLPTATINELEIPVLDSLYAWAEANSALIKQQEALMEKTSEDTKRVKKQWLDAIKVSGNIRAGNYGNSTINQVETGYSYGPYVSFSLYELASNKNLVGVYQAEEKVALYKREQALFDLKRYVAQLYNNINTQKQLLKIRSDAVNASYVHVKMAEKEFNEGAATLGELSRVTEIYTKSQTDLILTINDLKTFYMQLEQVCGRTF